MNPTTKKAVLFLVMFLSITLIYRVVGEITLERGSARSFTTELDKAIPFVPQMAVFYLSLYLGFWTIPIIFQEISYAYFTKIVLATFIAFFFCSIIYMIIPSTYNNREIIVGGNFFAQTLVRNGIYKYDLPNNTIPSTHAALATILLLATAKKFNFWFFLRYLLWGIAIITSTLLIKQHHIIDVLTGIFTGWISLYLSNVCCKNYYSPKNPR